VDSLESGRVTAAAIDIRDRLERSEQRLEWVYVASITQGSPTLTTTKMIEER